MDIDGYALIEALARTGDPVPGSEVEWSDIIDMIEDVEPGPGLEALRMVKERLGHYTRYLEEREEDLVLKAQVEMMPWSKIGRLLGVSAQAAWKKHHDPGDTIID